MKQRVPPDNSFFNSDSGQDHCDAVRREVPSCLPPALFLWLLVLFWVRKNDRMGSRSLCFYHGAVVPTTSELLRCCLKDFPGENSRVADHLLVDSATQSHLVRTSESYSSLISVTYFQGSILLGLHS